MEGEVLFASPLDRQIDESLRIKYSEAEVIKNSGSEWSMDRTARARVGQFSRPAESLLVSDKEEKNREKTTSIIMENNSLIIRKIFKLRVYSNLMRV